MVIFALIGGAGYDHLIPMPSFYHLGWGASEGLFWGGAVTAIFGGLTIFSGISWK